MDNEKEKERIAAFCKHRKWSQVLGDISDSVATYEDIKRKLSEDAFPLDVGRFRLVVSYAQGKGFILATEGEAIYSFSISWEPLPDEEPAAEEEAKPPARNFYGATGPGENPEMGRVTHVNMVAWKRLFALEEFSRAIKGILPDLEARLQEKNEEDREAATSFDEYLDGASELLKEE